MAPAVPPPAVTGPQGRLPDRLRDDFPINYEDGVSMQVEQLGIDGVALELGYSVINRTRQPIYLINRLFHRRPDGFEVDHELTYNSAQGSMLFLAKQMIAVPEHLDVEAPEVPYATPLGPGEHFAETIRQSLPLGHRDPYYREGEGAVRRFDRVVFSLGYVLADVPLEVADVPGRDGTVLKRIGHAALRLRQRLKACGPFPADIDAAIEPAEPAR